MDRDEHLKLLNRRNETLQKEKNELAEIVQNKIAELASIKSSDKMNSPTTTPRRSEITDLIQAMKDKHRRRLREAKEKYRANLMAVEAKYRLVKEQIGGKNMQLAAESGEVRGLRNQVAELKEQLHESRRGFKRVDNDFEVERGKLRNESQAKDVEIARTETLLKDNRTSLHMLSTTNARMNEKLESMEVALADARSKIKQNEGEKKRWISEIRAARAENEMQRAANDEMQIQRCKMEDEIRSMAENQDEIKAQCDYQMAQQRAQFKQSVIETEKHFETVQAGFERERGHYEAVEAESQGVISEMTSEIESLREDVAEFQLKNQELSDQRDAYGQELLQAREMVAELEWRNEQIAVKKGTLEEELGARNSELSDAEVEIDKLKTEQMELYGRIKTFHDVLEEEKIRFAREIEARIHEVSEGDGLISRLRGELYHAKKCAEAVNDELEESKNRESALMTRMVKMEREKESMITEKSQGNEALNAMKESLSKAELRTSRLDREIENLKMELDDANDGRTKVVESLQDRVAAVNERLSQKMTAYSALEERYRTLEIDAHESAKRVNDLSVAIGERDAKYAVLNDTNVSLNTRQDNMQSEIEQLRDERDRVNKVIFDLKSENERLISESQIAQSGLSEKVRELEATLDEQVRRERRTTGDAKSEAQGYRDEIERLGSELAVAQRRIVAQSSQIDGLNNQIECDAVASATLKTQNDELRNAKETCQVEITDLARQIEERETIIDSLKADAIRMSSELETTRVGYNDERQRLTAELRQHQETLENHSRDLTMTNESVQQLESELIERRETFERKELEISRLQFQKKRLLTKLDAVTTENENLKETVAALKETNADVSRDRYSLEVSLEDLRQRLLISANSTAEIITIARAIRASIDPASEPAMDPFSIGESDYVLCETLTILREVMVKSQTDVEVLVHERDHLRQTAIDLKKHLVSMRRKERQRTERIDELESRNESIMNEVRKVDTLNDGFDAEREHLNEGMDRLRTSVRVLRKTLQDLERENQTLKERLALHTP